MAPGNEEAELGRQHHQGARAHTRMHAVALAKLATEVNTRARAAFGGNFPELVWVSDCYECNPANAQKDMAPINANIEELGEAVLVLSQVLADGLASSSTPVVADPSPAPSPALPVGELDDVLQPSKQSTTAGAGSADSFNGACQ